MGPTKREPDYGEWINRATRTTFRPGSRAGIRLALPVELKAADHHAWGVRDVVAKDSEVVHGYPHLDTVRAAITALYKRISPDGVHSYAPSVLPADVAFADQDDLHLGAQRVAHALVQHLRLPDARMVVSFREMHHAASVELVGGPEYFIELNDRFRTHRRDIGAALAHEIMHVLLHRLDLAFPGTRDNEILTDTATTYLGAGWLLLDAFREDGVSSQKLGYLTPRSSGTSWPSARSPSARTPRPGSPARRATPRTPRAAPWPCATPSSRR